MYTRDSGRVQDKLINKLERQEKQRAFQQGRFFRFKLPEIHNKLRQTLLEEKIIETENAAAVSDSILKGLKMALNSSEFDFKYFVSPIRNLVPRPNPYSLYMTQYLMEILINDPDVIEIYGTDEDIYRSIDRIFTQSRNQFEKVEKDVVGQLAQKKSLTPGSAEYKIAMDQLLREKLGDPQK
ncbi:MAG: DUF507 family protein [Candidatus Desulfacyla sp.]